MNNELYQLLLSLKIGDGGYVTQSKGKTYHLTTNSVNEDYVLYKQHKLEQNGIITRTRHNLYSGYVKDKRLFGFFTHIDDNVSKVGNMSVKDVLNDLDLLGLIYYYLDDGSLHKTKHFMHIYCNSFTVEEAGLLIEVLYKYFPQKRCALRWDKKKDGRSFPYLYVPTCVAREFSIAVRQLLIDNNIHSLLYKTIPPSQTIENITQ